MCGCIRLPVCHWYSISQQAGLLHCDSLLIVNEDPDWASYKLGVFVCLNCSGTHRNLPAVSRIKSIRLDFWDDELVEVWDTSGITELHLRLTLENCGCG